jgi:DNA invertase Pin-like site-specific DNA recombinase
MILADRARAPGGPASKSFWPRSVRAASAPCSRWRPPGWRNGRDWHTLLEFCGLVGTLIVDEDGIYDPTSPNDRLLLGMKGTMSEMELSVFRQRSIEAMKQKARRGELFLTVAVGYVKAGGDRIREPDRDRR